MLRRALVSLAMLALLLMPFASGSPGSRPDARKSDSDLARGRDRQPVRPQVASVSA